MFFETAGMWTGGGIVKDSFGFWILHFVQLLQLVQIVQLVQVNGPRVWVGVCWISVSW